MQNLYKQCITEWQAMLQSDWVQSGRLKLFAVNITSWMEWGSGMWDYFICCHYGHSNSLFNKVCARYRVASLQQLSKGAIHMYQALYPSTHIPASVSGNKSLPVWEFWWDKVITECSRHAPWWERNLGCSLSYLSTRSYTEASRTPNSGASSVIELSDFLCQLFL